MLRWRNVVFASSFLWLLPACSGGGGKSIPTKYDKGNSSSYDVLPYPDYGISKFDTGPTTTFDTGSTTKRDGGVKPRSDAYVAQPAKCGGSKIRLQEMAVGQPDFIALKNTGSAPVDIAGYTLVMIGISPNKPDIYTFTAKSVPAGATVYVFEYKSGKQAGDVNTGANIPFYDGPPAKPTSSIPNVAMLRDAAGNLVDYVAVQKALSLPSGASFTPIPWPANWDAKVSSFQRSANSGACPNFKASDWAAKGITRKK